MKTKYNLILLFIFLCIGGLATAQIELPESAKKGLEKYNKEQKEKETPNESENAKQTKKEQEWMKEWEKNKEDLSEAASYFNTKGLNCIFLTVLYLDAYLNLVELTNNEGNGQMKCDLLGMQGVAIGMSTMILYCPEYLSGLTRTEKAELTSGLRSILKSKNKSAILDQWIHKFNRVMKKLFGIDVLVDFYPEDIDYLAKYFHPESIVSQSLNVVRHMEALGCDDY